MTHKYIDLKGNELEYHSNFSGRRVDIDDFGILTCKTSYVNGEIHGIKQRYDLFSGKVRDTIHYINGKAEGVCEGHYSDGTTHKAFYVNDRLHGDYIVYNELNEVIKKAIYKDGRLMKSITYENNKITCIKVYTSEYYKDKKCYNQ